jgi:hypothetical protein
MRKKNRSYSFLDTGKFIKNLLAFMGQRYGCEYTPCESKEDAKELNIQMVYCFPESNARIRPE